MKKDIKTFLKNIEIMPIDKKHWNVFNINHIKPIKDEREKIREVIINEVGNLSGVYIYKDKSSRVLYVGKGNPLREIDYICTTVLLLNLFQVILKIKDGTDFGQLIKAN